MAGTKTFILSLLLFVIGSEASGQLLSSGRIVYERKTNLKKRYGDNPRLKNFITEQNKYRIENFELLFNDTSCVFRPIEEEEKAEGFMKYLTTQNTVYQNLNKREKFIAMDMWGNAIYIRDSMDSRKWKITDSKRFISGYNCRKAIWEMNDSTRIYAWYATEVIPSIGPEGFEGLPGAILGLATEDGGVIYFAKEVKVFDTPKATLQYSDKGKEIYTEDQLKEILKQRVGQWMKPADIESMFSWL